MCRSDCLPATLRLFGVTMTSPDIESTLHATYSELAWVSGVLIFGSLAVIVALVGRIAHG